MRIDDLIIVEGREDIRAIKTCVDAEVMATGGSYIKESFLQSLVEISKRKGVIIFTDPDYTGNKIRQLLSKRLPKAKQAYLSQGQAMKKGDIGIENASCTDILAALKQARASLGRASQVFEREDLVRAGLMAGPGSKAKREELGQILGIGYGNSKQLLSRLNSFGIQREEFDRAIEEIGSKYE